jgi:hypothetical protein
MDIMALEVFVDLLLNFILSDINIKAFRLPDMEALKPPFKVASSNFVLHNEINI